MEPVSNIARKAIHAWGGSRNVNVGTESCSICLEAACLNLFYEIPPCLHRYCKQCLSKHVQFKLLQGLLPKCPYEDCSSELKIYDCQKFLNDDWVEIMKDRLKEAAIPPKEKLYCPYSTCSTLLSMSEIRSQKQLRQSSASSSNDAGQSGAIECPNYFCSSCKVPWHDNLSRSEFKELDQVTEADEKLQALATQKMWRQIPNNNN
ncbi:PREDICTED: probable E3 ubiquitin-protein ligase RNF144A-A [Erythranthe guttata]|uniref:probable E3 ubiquitin-protein ligase RNF144A-A n=1 Tax=Erythranthe guttata TaxID=4155 RepID=UPI00064DAB8B|nr:PREDICTED: probable E3 ubiquitin-protein ligase RNF144A-A [Erythranthe guttata]|eukprot:XP_012838335.1 PREDICTED: probable E3 ubiquitin-protein ligase RNF144A-A [Erythranthe guttata]